LLLVLFVKTITGTVRFRLKDESGFFDTPPAGQAIYSCWHNRLALCLPAYLKFARPRNQTRGLAAMVSASRDGAFLSAVLQTFQVQPVRGSTSRRGRQALLEMTRWAERGYDLAITPDGPRGPRYQVQPGIISLAQVTGLPILPFSYHLRWKFSIRSWDRFQVPLPFGTCELRTWKPLRIPRDADEAERERLRVHLEQTMNLITTD
jgi:lysophospholipid acyltransferase (LPLAT)-like uncharacterized protein